MQMKMEIPMIAEDTVAALAEFKLVFKNWVRHRVDWRAIFPHTDLGNLDIMDDLMDVDMDAVYHGLMKSDPDRSKCLGSCLC